jgi:hypothetical protein
MIPAAERVILVGLEHEGVSRWDLQDSLEELRLLADTAGAKVVETVIQRLDKPTAPFYIGKGKAEEIAKSSGEKQATSVIFDDELSPAQSRNLEEITHRKVIDRSQLILDIFAARARTREGRLQIELAQLQYLLPRLTGMWSHLSRQSGGIGTRMLDRAEVRAMVPMVGDRVVGAVLASLSPSITAANLVRPSDASPAESARLAGPEIPRLGLLTRDELGQAFGRDALVNIGILNAGWAERLTTEHARLAGFRPAATTD